MADVTLDSTLNGVDGTPLAAIDIGSNSFRLEIGQFVEGRYRRIDYLKQTVRLGAGLDEDGLLTEPAMQRGLSCLHAFAERLSGMGSMHVRAVATQTLREACNRNAFLERARVALGREIEVIAGREEARLIYAGVTLLQPSTESRLVVDIGGRSTELILGHGPMPRVAESFGLGCVSHSQRFFEDGKITERGFHAAQIAAGAELEEAQHSFDPRLWTRALGSSGTAGAVSQVLAVSRQTDGCITADGLRWLIARCIEAGHVDRLDLPGLKPDRRAVIPGGLAILVTLFANFGIELMWPARGALRHGVLGDLRERLAAQAMAEGHDQRDDTVAELQQRFGVDAAQAEHVRGIALALFDAAPRAVFDDRRQARRELAWACALHEIGLMVSHHDHHRHSAYLMAKVDAPGFSQTQQNHLAGLLLGQRGRLKKLSDSLTEPSFAWQLLCLRVAAIACHARAAVGDDALVLRGHDDVARLAWTPRWARAHPRTVYLLQEEAAAWARHGTLRLQLPD